MSILPPLRPTDRRATTGYGLSYRKRKASKDVDRIIEKKPHFLHDNSRLSCEHLQEETCASIVPVSPAREFIVSSADFCEPVGLPMQELHEEICVSIIPVPVLPTSFGEGIQGVQEETLASIVSPANFCDPIPMQVMNNQEETCPSMLLPDNFCAPIHMQEASDQVERNTEGSTASEAGVMPELIGQAAPTGSKETTSNLIQCAQVFLQKCKSVVQFNNNELIVRNCEGGIVTKEVRFSDRIQVFCYEKEVPLDHPFLCDLKNTIILPENVEGLNELINKWHSCHGITDNAYKDAYSKMFNKDQGRICHLTNSVHSRECSLLTCTCRTSMCNMCRRYSYSLQRANKAQKRQGNCVSSSLNNRFMTRNQLLTKVRSIKERLKKSEKRCKELRKKLTNLINNHGHVLPEDDNRDFCNILEKALPCLKESNLVLLFIEQQLKAVSCEKSSSMRWHPMMIKFCLYLQQKSPSGYEAMRRSGFIKLPSKRTVRDYRMESTKQGFQEEAFKKLADEAAKLQKKNIFIALLHDEMKIRDDIVYDKHTGEIVGFTDLTLNWGAIDSVPEKDMIQKTVATHILQLMVRGITSRLVYPLAFFPCTSMLPHELYMIIWNAVKNLELLGLKVLLVVCDGAGINRKFFKMCTQEHIPYKTINLYASDEERFIYFISDAPHLMKTTRNCFSNSNFHKKSRRLWNNGEILWTHLIEMFEKDSTAIERHAPKLNRAHIYLTAQSMMKVKLATQVMSATVAAALQQLLGEKATATVSFIRTFNKFFDILNTRNLLEGRLKRNDNLKPFCNQDDPRLKWLECDFLKYLENWEAEVQKRPGNYSPADRKKMMLSRETLEGLKITVNSTVQYVKFLLERNEKFILTEHASQDQLEQYFALQRHCGGANENPTVKQYEQNANKLKSLKSLKQLLFW